MDNTIYDFTVKNLQGKEVSLSDYKGKVLLIVNTATHCGQVPQLGKLEKLYQQYRDQGFEVLGFPSNQFAGQEPLKGKDIEEFCQVNYGVNFTMFDKVMVRGKNAHPLFKYFRNKKENKKIAVQPMWNYYKFLIDRNGKVVDYFFTYTQPDNKRLVNALEKTLMTDQSILKPSAVL